MNHEMATSKLSEKKRNRLESKKKKAEAFLALVGHKRESAPISIDSHASYSTDKSFTSTTYSPNLDETNPTDPHSDSKEKMENTSHTEHSAGKSLDPVEEMKAILRARKKAIMQKPKVFLTLEEMVPFRAMPNNPIEEDEIPALYVMDLQQLLLYGIQGNRASYKPRWCKVLRVGKVSSVVLLMVDNISYDDYFENQEHFPYLSNSFDTPVEIVCPMQYGHSVEEELFNVPLSVSQLKKANVKVPDNIQKSVVAKIARPVCDPSVESFSRKCLLLSTYQMMQEGYPMPIKTKGCKYRNFVFTKDKYEEVTEKSPLFAVDCEMCYTTIRKNELTRVSIVTEAGEVIYDELVKPKNRIIDYLTRYSGITKELLDPVTKSLEEVQQDVKNLLPPDAILCGQSLNSDLLALKVFHPYVIDTSVIFNMSGNRRIKAGLRKLAQFFLGRTIQADKGGHCSAEDATATLDLVKLKLSKGLEFGDATLSGVYFPDIRTYFMGSQGGGKQVTENVEQNCAEHRTEALSVNGLVSKTKTQLSPLQQTCSEDDNKCSSLKSEKPSSSFQQGPASNQSSSASSSSSSDSETEGSHSVKKRKPNDQQPEINAEVCVAKKAKLEDKHCDLKGQINQTENTSVGEEADSRSTVKFVRIQQEHLFNQDNSVHIPHSFFHLVKEAGRTACVIDTDKFMQQYHDEPVEKVEVTSDSEVRRQSKESVQKKEFVMAQWRGFHSDMDTSINEKQRLMRKLDKKLHSVVKKIPINALVVVVLKGRTAENLAHNMALFMKTT
ncbi:REXON_0 protein [Elysia marginata]|uniref:REXON_0 protein n=1 Tax=Elysia marginata TaxID=1093978 RepID=A0AAV4EAQ5_9GAST|nr:REXON_0 protein [Elysia marginata]